MAHNDDEAAPAILQSDPLKRLDAIVRRHGGKPFNPPTARMVLPSPGRRKCKGQMFLGQDDADADA